MPEVEASGALGITEREWERVRGYVHGFHEPGRFVTLLAYEGNLAAGGHHNVFFKSPEHWPRPPRYSDPADLFAELVAGLAIAIPHHLGINWGRDMSPVTSPELQPVTDPTRTIQGPWLDWSPVPKEREIRPALEIYSGHGQSEHFDPSDPLAYEQVRFTPAVSQDGPHYAQDAWLAGQLLGTIAASDSHRGQPGLSHYGLTAVVGSELSREAVFEGIRSRSTYATTGQRLYLELGLAGEEMGQIVTVGSESQQSLDGQLLVAAPRSIRIVELLLAPVQGPDQSAEADGSWQRLLEVEPGGRVYSTDYSIELGRFSDLPRRDGPELVLYLRTELADPHPVGHPGARAVRGWTSPIWIDFE